MSRKLASIQIIKDIQPIPDADRIEVAVINGWKCVVKKNEFRVGQKVVYFEIDSFLPCVEDYEFLRASSYKNSPILGEGFRIKTQKLRGVISQGLILPIETCFKDCMPVCELEEGEDVTEILNVKKWEEPETALIGGNPVGKRPEFIKYTHEERIQNYPEVLEEFYACDYVYATTKIDGSSHSIGIDRDGNFHATSHNLELRDEGKKGSFYQFCKDNNLEEKLRRIMRHYDLNEIVVQGEYYGPGIQKNKLGMNKPSWRVFTVDFNGERQDLAHSRIATEDYLSNIDDELVVRFVPIVWYGTGKEFKDQFPTVDSLLKAVEGDLAEVYVNHQNEGWVIRPRAPKYSSVLNDTLSIKVINNKYLLKEK